MICEQNKTSYTSKLTKYKLAVLIVCINVTSMDLNYPQLNLIESFALHPLFQLPESHSIFFASLHQSLKATELQNEERVYGHYFVLKICLKIYVPKINVL